MPPTQVASTREARPTPRTRRGARPARPQARRSRPQRAVGCCGRTRAGEAKPRAEGRARVYSNPGPRAARSGRAAGAGVGRGPAPNTGTGSSMKRRSARGKAGRARSPRPMPIGTGSSAAGRREREFSRTVRVEMEGRAARGRGHGGTRTTRTRGVYCCLRAPHDTDRVLGFCGIGFLLLGFRLLCRGIAPSLLPHLCASSCSLARPLASQERRVSPFHPPPRIRCSVAAWRARLLCISEASPPDLKLGQRSSSGCPPPPFLSLSSFT